MCLGPCHGTIRAAQVQIGRRVLLACTAGSAVFGCQDRALINHIPLSCVLRRPDVQNVTFWQCPCRPAGARRGGEAWAHLKAACVTVSLAGVFTCPLRIPSSSGRSRSLPNLINRRRFAECRRRRQLGVHFGTSQIRSP